MKTFSEIITFANKPTGGGQIYSKQLLNDAFDIYMSKDKLFRYGCLDAPTGYTINSSDVSHYLLDVWWKEDTLWGEIEIATDKEAGRVLEQLVDMVPETLTLGLAAMAAFKPVITVESRELFKDYAKSPSQEVDDMAVFAVYVLPKSNTNH